MPCKLTFVSNTCFIQDVQTLQRIGTVDLVEGLYKLNMKKSDFVFVTSSVSSNSSTYSCNKVVIDLWHFGLRHPSFEGLQLLKQSHPLHSVDKQFVCPTCHHAKQRKFSFPSSDSHSFPPPPFLLYMLISGLHVILFL